MYSSFKKQQLITESWRRFLNEAQSIPEDPLELIEYYSNKARETTKGKDRYGQEINIPKYKYPILKELYAILLKTFTEKEYLLQGYLNPKTKQTAENLSKAFKNFLSSKLGGYFPEISDEEPEYLKFNPFMEKEDRYRPLGLVYDYESIYHHLYSMKQSNQGAKAPEKAIEELEKILENLKSDSEISFTEIVSKAINTIDSIVKNTLSTIVDKDYRKWYTGQMEQSKQKILKTETKEELIGLLTPLILTLKDAFVVPSRTETNVKEFSDLMPSQFIDQIIEIFEKGIDYFSLNTTKVVDLVSKLSQLINSVSNTLGKTIISNKETARKLEGILEPAHEFKQKLMLIITAIDTLKKGGIGNKQAINVDENLDREKIQSTLSKEFNDVFELESNFIEALRNYSPNINISHISSNPAYRKTTSPLDIPAINLGDFPPLFGATGIGKDPALDGLHESKKSKRRR